MTHSNNARVHVHAPDPASQGQKLAHSNDSSASTRAIPRISAGRKGVRARDRTLLHVVEARDDVQDGWALTEAPPPANAMWQQVAPSDAPGKTAWVLMTVAGLFRAVTVTGAWLVALSVATRTRAGVGLVVVVLITAASLTVRIINS